MRSRRRPSARVTATRRSRMRGSIGLRPPLSDDRLDRSPGAGPASTGHSAAIRRLGRSVVSSLVASAPPPSASRARRRPGRLDWSRLGAAPARRRRAGRRAVRQARGLATPASECSVARPGLRVGSCGRRNRPGTFAGARAGRRVATDDGDLRRLRVVHDAPPAGVVGEPDEVQLGLELDAGLLEHPALDLTHQRADVGRGRARLGLDEVGVLRRDDRTADAAGPSGRSARSGCRRSPRAGCGTPIRRSPRRAGARAASARSRRCAPRTPSGESVSTANVAPATTSFGPIAERPVPERELLDGPVDAEPVAQEVTTTRATAAPRGSRDRDRPRSCAPRRRRCPGCRRRTRAP